MREPVRPVAASRLRLPKDPATLAYIAGLLDGEGSICILGAHDEAGQRNRVQIRITNTHAETMHWLHQFGGTLSRERNRHHRTPIWNWQVARRAEVIDLLETLLPFLRIKHSAAEAALAHARARMVEVAA